MLASRALPRLARANGVARFTCKQPSRKALHSTSRQMQARNQIYDPVRRPDSFHTYLTLSSSSRTPLITLWTASWCPTCKAVQPLLQSMIESGIGEAEGSVGYCSVEYDAPDVMAAGFGLIYMISSLPTLLSFDAGEAQLQTKESDGKKLTDPRFLEEWIRSEARRHGSRGGGGPAFGGLFGKWK